MSAGDQGGSGGPLSSEQVLSELEFLATVEHALIVECLSVHCALGHDLAAASGGPTTEQGSAAAALASGLAQGEMFHLKGVTNALIAAGRSAPLPRRAGSISSASVTEIPLAPPTLAQLQQLLTREEGIARAVDERYARLVPAVASDTVFHGDLLDELRSVIADGQSHVNAFAGFRQSLGDVPPADVLRATRRGAADDFEQRLLDASDRAYALTVQILGLEFTPEANDVVPFRPLAIQAMTGLDDITCVLVQRALLPPFTALT